MGRTLALLAMGLLALGAPAWGSPGGTADPLYDSSQPSPSPPLAPDATGYLPPWRVVLQRLFRAGLGRILRAGTRRLRRGRALIAGPLAGVLAVLVGPCGRLWRWLLG